MERLIQIWRSLWEIMKKFLISCLVLEKRKPLVPQQYGDHHHHHHPFPNNTHRDKNKMESLIQIRHSLWEIMKKFLISYLVLEKRKPLVPQQYGDFPCWNLLHQILEYTEAQLSFEESELQVRGGIVDKGFEKWAKHVLSLSGIILQGDLTNKEIRVDYRGRSTDRQEVANILERLVSKMENPGEVKLVELSDEILQPQNMCWTLFRNRARIEFDSCILLEIAMELYNQYRHDPSLLNIAALFWSDVSVNDWEVRRDNIVKDASKTKLFSLKLSRYEQLQSNIKIYVHYCSLFPKGYTFNKTDLIHLWPSVEHLLTAATMPANPESVGFVKLLEEGYFFENFQGNGTSDTFGYKMHYVVSEFVKEIAKPEFCLVDECHQCHEEIDFANILHLSFLVDSSWKAPSWLLTASKLQSLLFLPRKLYEDSSEVSEINESITRLTCLRALDLTAMNCKNLPSSLGELKDLRYLKLGVSLENLPESVTRLENLQTLDLRHSRVNSSDFHTFRHLRHLYFGSRLVDNPSEVWELDSLQTLEVCVVSQTNYWLDAQDWFNDPFGKLRVRFEKQHEHGLHGENLKDKSADGKGETSVGGSHRSLQPSPNLKSIIPENLVSVCIEDCNNCKSLPHLGSLPYLRSLQLWDLKALEFVDNSQPSDSYFPSLEYLMLANLQELKGWSSDSSQKQQQPICSNRLQLKIKGCPKLKSMPPIPNLVSLEAHDLDPMLLRDLSSTWMSQKLQNLEIVSAFELDSILSETSTTLELLKIRQCPKLKTMGLSYDARLPRDIYEWLQQLVIHECSGLKDINQALLKFPALQKLEIMHCEKLNLGDNIMKVAREGLLQRLYSLKLIGISNLESLENGLIALKKLEELSLHSFYELKALPEWIGKLTKLQCLAIRNCPYLITLPDSLGSLSTLQKLEIQCCPLLKQIPNSFARLKSLQQLKIQQCPKLFTRCQTSGEDFPLIEHIPYFILLE